MEEDVVGTERVLSHREYVTCSHCGTIVERYAAALVPADALDGGSELRYLCADCQRSLADGDHDLPADDF